MAFSPDSFKKALGKPMGAPAGGAPMGGGEMDLGSLMGEPGEAGELGNSPSEEASESSLESALEAANIQANPDQIAQIKDILGLSGGMVPEGPEAGMGSPSPVPPAPKASSKIGKLFSK